MVAYFIDGEWYDADCARAVLYERCYVTGAGTDTSTGYDIESPCVIFSFPPEYKVYAKPDVREEPNHHRFNLNENTPSTDCRVFSFATDSRCLTRNYPINNHIRDTVL